MPPPTAQSDKDIDRMREIHVELDRAVLDAYGWSDIDPAHGFHTYRQMQRWTLSPTARVEILDLLEENHRRAEKEPQARHTSAAAEIPPEEGTLFT